MRLVLVHLALAGALAAASCLDGGRSAAVGDTSDAGSDDADVAPETVADTLADTLADTAADVAPDAPDAVDPIDGDTGYCVPLRPDGCPEAQPPEGFAPVCEHACLQADRGKSCDYPERRCTCELGSGLQWMCEPSVCPADGEAQGDACTTPGLRCDAGFEERGLVCIPGDLVWVHCVRAAIDPMGHRLHCPPVPPPEGGRCCVESPGFVPDDCPYPDASGAIVSWRCIDYRWAPTP